MAISKVLCVDDSATDLQHIQDIVSDAGYYVITASSGIEAVSKAKSENPDLIFMDIVMNDMDGYKTCRTLSKDTATAAIPIIFLTSKDQKADMVRAESKGAKGYIVKPAKMEEVVAQINKAVA